MVTETRERTVLGDGENGQEEPEAEVTEASAEAKEGEQRKEEAPKETSPFLSFKTKEEYDAHLEKEATRRATSIANKSTATYQQQVEDLRGKLRLAEQGIADKQEDDALARLEKKQSATYQDEEDLPDFQEAQKTLLSRARDLKKKETDFEAKYSKSTQNVRQQQAFTKALELYLVPEDKDEFFSTVKTFAGKLAEAQTDREMDLLYSLEEERLKRLAEAEPNRRRAKPLPESPTVPPGHEFSSDNPAATIAEGIRRLKFNK